jgi:hypothetical protein
MANAGLLQILAQGPQVSGVERFQQGQQRGLQLADILDQRDARQFIPGAIDGDKGALAQLLGLAPEIGMQVSNTLENRAARDEDRSFRVSQAAQAQKNSDRQYQLDVQQFGQQVANQNWQRRYQQGLLDAKEDPYGDRDRAAARFGLKPGSPEHQAFVLTGRMPQEQRSTAADRAAIREADDMAFSAENAIGQLKEAQALNDKAGSGYFAGTQSFLARNDPTGFFDDAKGQATTEFTNLVLNQALGSLKTIFGAAPTEGERAILVELQASVDKSPAERKAILDRAVGLAERRMAFQKDRGNELRGGTYYQPGGGPSEAQAPSPDGSTAPPANADALIEQANDAISRGADPAKVQQRLREQGIEADFAE